SGGPGGPGGPCARAARVESARARSPSASITLIVRFIVDLERGNRPLRSIPAPGRTAEAAPSLPQEPLFHLLPLITLRGCQLALDRRVCARAHHGVAAPRLIEDALDPVPLVGREIEIALEHLQHRARSARRAAGRGATVAPVRGAPGAESQAREENAG